MKHVINIILLLISGLLVYWLFRPGIILFNAFGIHNNNPITISNGPLSILVKNYLPDFLWALAVIKTAQLLQEKQIAPIYVYTLFALPFLSEILQGFKIIPGTFDWYDLLVYLIAFLYCFNLKILELCKKKLKPS